MLKVNTVSDALGTLSYTLDDPVQVLRSSVELYSAFLYHTRNTVCTISEITVNASIEKLPGTVCAVHFATAIISIEKISCIYNVMIVWYICTYERYQILL